MAKRKSSASGREAAEGRRIDFLGYSFSRGNTRLRKSIKKRFARKVKEIKSVERRKQVLASYWGWCKWGDCRNLWNTITENDMSFANRGISGSTTMKDGKRFFRNKELKAMDILNNPIVVLDFETGIKTKHGPDRYAVLFKRSGEDETFKLVTNSFSIKSVLDQARTHDERLKELQALPENQRDGLSEDDLSILSDGKPVLPCETVLKRREIGGGKYDYYFE